MPVIKNFTAASCSHPGSPTILTDLSAQGIGTVDLKGSSVPFSHYSLIGSPFSLCGVWQSPHIPMFSTRYFPCSIFAGETLERVFGSPLTIDTNPSARMATTTMFLFITGVSLFGCFGGLAEI